MCQQDINTNTFYYIFTKGKDVMKRKIYIGFVIFTILSWGGVNYANYYINHNLTEQTIRENVEFIDQAVDDISTEQKNLKETEAVLENLPKGVNPFISEMSTVAPNIDLKDASQPDNTLVSELRQRINKLEMEKQEYMASKTHIVQTVADRMNIFKWDIKNPLLNVVILPLVLYFGKRVLDIIFRLISNEIFEEENS